MKSIRKNGFSLIELLVVILIIGILAAIAIPAYSEHLIKARIAEATGGLSQMRLKIEQYYADNRTYVGFSCVAPGSTTYFDFTCPTLAVGTYRLVATGKGAMTNYVFDINQSNARSSQAPGGITAACWMKNKSGGC